MSFPIRRSSDAISERALIQRIRAGDETAFEAVLHTYYEPLCLFVEGYVRSPHMAEDTVQDVFFWIWRHRDTWDVRQSLTTYLYTAARNRALNERRHQRLVDRRRSAAPLDRRIAGIGQSAPSPADAVARGDLSRVLWTAVSRLPRRRREVVLLRWAHDLPYAEIARITGTSIKTVESHIRKALRTLRQELGPLL